MKVQLMLSVAALACGAAYAQDQATTAQGATTDNSIASIFTQLDTNGDGRISNEEAQASAVVTRSFAKADADGDGAINRDEFMSSFTAGGSQNSAPPPAAPQPEPPPNPQ